jgi:hypothetical protein
MQAPKFFFPGFFKIFAFFGIFRHFLALFGTFWHFFEKTREKNFFCVFSDFSLSFGRFFDFFEKTREKNFFCAKTPLFSKKRRLLRKIRVSLTFFRKKKAFT